jgi:SAM-dependent methyltransferase
MGTGAEVSMSFIGGALGIALLNLVSRNGAVERCDVATAYIGRSKLEVLLGPTIWDQTRGKDVLDFGCGPGVEVVEIAENGAGHVIGVDLRQRWLDLGSDHAAARGVQHRCTFAPEWEDPVDLIVSLDSFEHFADPAGVLARMRRLLRPGGRVLAAFGPTWYHPLGGHIYSVFPFSHLLFSERALVRWRALHKADGATTIAESGLNKMTIRRFIDLVARSPLRFARFELLPIRPLRLIASRATREFTTAAVRCELVPR